MEFESISPTFTKKLTKNDIKDTIDFYKGSIPYVLDKIWIKDLVKTYKHNIFIFPYAIDFKIKNNIIDNYTIFDNLLTNETTIIRDTNKLNYNFKKAS